MFMGYHNMAVLFQTRWKKADKNTKFTQCPYLQFVRPVSLLQISSTNQRQQYQTQKQQYQKQYQHNQYQ